jgi:hypothetical protein
VQVVLHTWPCCPTKFEADFVAAVVVVAVDVVRVADFSLSFKVALFGAVLNINKL